MRDWLHRGQNYNYPSLTQTAIPQQILSALDSVYHEFNYVPNLERFLLFYPDYLDRFSKYRHSLFHPQTVDTRAAYFLVIMVALEFGCVYMLSRASTAFAIHKGPRDWVLKDECPSYLRTLFPYIRKACKAPWSLCLDDFKYLKSQGWENNDLLVHIHCILWGISCCTIALALGLQPDEPCTLFDIKKIQEIKAKYEEVPHK